MQDTQKQLGAAFQEQARSLSDDILQSSLIEGLKHLQSTDDLALALKMGAYHHEYNV